MGSWMVEMPELPEERPVSEGGRYNYRTLISRVWVVVFQAASAIVSV
jgi:hypothetical protein